MKIYASKFQLAINRNTAYIIQWNKDECGLYGRSFRNNFGTSLMAKGTRKEMEELKDAN